MKKHYIDIAVCIITFVGCAYVTAADTLRLGNQLVAGGMALVAGVILWILVKE